MTYKGHLIFKIEGWYEIDGVAKNFATIKEAKWFIDHMK